MDDYELIICAYGRYADLFFGVVNRKRWPGVIKLCDVNFISDGKIRDDFENTPCSLTNGQGQYYRLTDMNEQHKRVLKYIIDAIHKQDEESEQRKKQNAEKRKDSPYKYKMISLDSIPEYYKNKLIKSAADQVLTERIKQNIRNGSEKISLYTIREYTANNHGLYAIHFKVEYIEEYSSRKVAMDIIIIKCNNKSYIRPFDKYDLNFKYFIKDCIDQKYRSENMFMRCSTEANKEVNAFIRHIWSNEEYEDAVKMLNKAYHSADMSTLKFGAKT